MALPPFREDGWLPEGHHGATWEEVALRFAGEPESKRSLVLAGLLRWRAAALEKGMAGLVILDGSFVSSKETPGDFDLVFLYDEATEALLRKDPEARKLTDYQACRALGLLGDIFALPASLQRVSPLPGGLDMFDFDRRGRPKGVIEVSL